MPLLSVFLLATAWQSSTPTEEASDPARSDRRRRLVCIYIYIFRRETDLSRRWLLTLMQDACCSHWDHVKIFPMLLRRDVSAAVLAIVHAVPARCIRHSSNYKRFWLRGHLTNSSAGGPPRTCTLHVPKTYARTHIAPSSHCSPHLQRPVIVRQSYCRK